MKYIIIEEHILQKFIDTVNRMISEGWKPQGGISTVECDGSSWYTQAMVKVD